MSLKAENQDPCRFRTCSTGSARSVAVRSLLWFGSVRHAIRPQLQRNQRWWASWKRPRRDLKMLPRPRRDLKMLPRPRRDLRVLPRPRGDHPRGRPHFHRFLRNRKWTERHPRGLRSVAYLRHGLRVQADLWLDPRLPPRPRHARRPTPFRRTGCFHNSGIGRACIPIR